MYAAVITTIGLTALAVTLSDGIDREIFGSIQFWMLAVAMVAGEFVSIAVPRRQQTLTVTVGDPFTLSLLFTFGLGPAILVKTIATLLDDIRRRQPWWKALFNVGQFSLSLAVGSFVANSLGSFGYSAGGPASIRAVDILAALAGALAYFLFNMAVVTTAISIAIGESAVTSFRNNLGTRIIQQGALLGFTPVVTIAVHDSAALFPLLLIPIVVVYYSGLLTQRHVTLAQQLSELYETTRITNARVGTQDAVRELLERVCNMFNATSAAITLFPAEGEEKARRTTVDVEAESFSYMVAVDTDPTQGVWARAASENHAILLPNPISNPRLRAYYEALGVHDLMTAPIHSEETATGVIEVFNRQGEGQTFSSEDLRLFQTLANHASIALENARLINELEESLEHLTEMNRLKDDFVASVSHELRTPLTSIQGYVKTLLRDDVVFPPDQQRTFLETVDRQSSRLHRLIEDLLAVSRLESQSDVMSRASVTIDALIKDVIEELRDKVAGRSIEVDLVDLPVIETDVGKVHQIVVNLLDNALKYTPDGSKITILGRPHGEGLIISVIDEGTGIPAEFQERIFDRFYQVDQSATRAVGGTGLGLYICRRMAEAIGGRVWLERSGSEGSVFSVWVPVETPVARLHSRAAAPGEDSAWKI
jgi:signal transduction histidine kinase